MGVVFEEGEVSGLVDDDDDRSVFEVVVVVVVVVFFLPPSSFCLLLLLQLLLDFIDAISRGLIMFLAFFSIVWTFYNPMIEGGKFQSLNQSKESKQSNERQHTTCNNGKTLLIVLFF